MTTRSSPKISLFEFMKIGTWTYENSDRQVVWYRGYVTVYHGRSTEDIPCPEVRKNKLKARDDARKLLAELRKEKMFLLNKLHAFRDQPISYPGSTSETIRIQVNKHLNSPEHLIHRRKERDRRYKKMSQCVVCKVLNKIPSVREADILYHIKERPTFYFVCHGCCVHQEELALFALKAICKIREQE